MQSREYYLLLLVFGASMLLPISTAKCETEQKTTVSAPPIVSPLPIELKAPELQKEASLQAKVSFEVKRQKLGELLAEMQKQTHITLTSAPDAPSTTALVTARVKEMPLADVMASFVRLYGITWTKTAQDEYRMNRTDRNELELQLLRLGDIDAYKRQFLLEGVRNQPQWASEILKYTDVASLGLEDGVPLSILPDDLKEKLRQQKQALAGLRLIENQHTVMEANLENYVLHIDAQDRKAQTRNGIALTPPKILIQSARGETIALIVIFAPLDVNL